MPYLLSRPPGAFDPGAGVMRADHFQMAYVTNDLDRALQLFGQRLGIREFVRLGGPMAAGGQMEARFAWVGTLMYEIICATGPGSEIFMERLAGAEGFTLKHHHLGFLIHDRMQWDALLANADDNGWDVPWRNANPLVEACFVRVPALEHYLEYLLPTQAGLDFFESVPRS